MNLIQLEIYTTPPLGTPEAIAMDEKIKSQLSIIIPVYNEDLTIRQVVSELLEKYRDSEIIVVDDGSDDETRYKLERLNVKVIRHQNTKGYGAALKTGIRNATKDVVITIDGDGEHSAGYIDLLIKDINLFDMIVGARVANAVQNFPFYQNLAKGFICLFLSLIFKQKILDINSGLRLMKKDIVEKYLSILSDGFSFTASITLAMLLDNYKIKYVPIGYHKRAGKSKIKIFNYTINFIRSYWRVIYHLRFIKRHAE